MYLCSHCDKRTRVVTRLKKRNKKAYWVTTCIKCGEGADIEEALEVRLKEDDKDRKKHNR